MQNKQTRLKLNNIDKYKECKFAWCVNSHFYFLPFVLLTCFRMECCTASCNSWKSLQRPMKWCKFPNRKWNLLGSLNELTHKQIESNGKSREIYSLCEKLCNKHSLILFFFSLDCNSAAAHNHKMNQSVTLLPCTCGGIESMWIYRRENGLKQPNIRIYKHRTRRTTNMFAQ